MMPLPHDGADAARPGAHRAAIVALAALGAIAAAFLLDRVAYQSISTHDRAAFAAVESKDWYRLLRIAGYWPTWAVVSLVLLLTDRVAHRANPARRATFLALSTGLAGFLTEGLKYVIGRMRPEDTGGSPLEFMGWAQRFAHGSDLSMPSSHAAVAFAGAFAGARLWPGARPVLLLLAAGCGLTRILAAAHFLSDIAAAAAFGLAVAALVSRLDSRNNPGRPIAR